MRTSSLASGLCLCVGSVAAQAPIRPVSYVTPSGVAYDVAGRGRDILLIHGFTADRRMWDPVLSALVGSGYRVIRMDLRSHGRSAASGPAYRNGDDVLAVLDAAHSSSAVVMGHSAGASAAVEGALERPSLIAGLVMVAASVNGLRIGATPPDLSELRQLLRVGDDSAATDAWLRLPMMRVDADTRTRLRFEEMIRTNARVWRAAPPGATTATPWARIGELRTPTLLVSGERDPGSREVADSISRHLSVTSVVIGSSGHWVPVERPAELLQALRLLDRPKERR